MPSKPITAGESPEGKQFPQPTPQDTALFFNIIKNMKNAPDIDWEGVAQDSSLKNGNVAKVRFRQIKQKLGLEQKGGPRTPTSGRKTQSRPQSANDTTAVSPETGPTPTKVTKRRATPARLAVKKEAAAVTVAPTAAAAPEPPVIKTEQGETTDDGNTAAAHIKCEEDQEEKHEQKQWDIDPANMGPTPVYPFVSPDDVTFYF